MTDYQPRPGDEVLLTVRAKVDGLGAYGVISGRMDGVVWFHGESPAIVRVEPAPIPVPTDLGAVILAEVKSVPPGVLGPIRLFAIRNPDYDEPGWDSPVAWIATEGTRDIYQEREITRVHAVLLPGESGG